MKINKTVAKVVAEELLSLLSAGEQPPPMIIIIISGLGLPLSRFAGILLMLCVYPVILLRKGFIF